MRIDIAIFDGVDELDAVGPLEVLRRAGFDVWLVTLTPADSVRCAAGLQIIPDGLVREDADLIVFPGGGWNDRRPNGTRAEVSAKRWDAVIERAAARGAVLTSVCTGAMFLASSGALKGRRATTHHGALADLEAAGAVVVHERVVDDGDRVTAGGVTSGIDLGLHLVERFAGRDKAEQIAKELEYPTHHHAC